MKEPVYQNFDIEDHLGVVAEQKKGRFLDFATLQWFSVRCVSPLNLFQTGVGWSDYVRLDDVVFLPRGAFEFSRYKSDYPAEPVLTFVCWDALGDPQDICAWQPVTGKIATWIGRAALLGEDNLNAPQLNGGLHVHPDALAWFRAKRSGVVIVDPRRAAAMLRDAGTLIASSTEHGRKLKKILDVPPPRILVPKPAEPA
jgi:hypothetical protein